jgi:hypothetical protein
MGRMKDVFMLMQQQPELNEYEAYQIIISQNKQRIDARRNKLQTDGRDKSIPSKKVMD